MKKLLLLASAFLTLVPVCKAETIDLMAHAIPQDAKTDHPETFYQTWEVYNENGERVTDESKRPYSCFVQSRGGLACDYNGNNYTFVNADPRLESLADGKVFLMAKYPECKEGQYCYAYPVNVPADGEYTLSGAVGFNEKKTTDTAVLNLLSRLFVVPQEEVTKSSFNVNKQEGKLVMSTAQGDTTIDHMKMPHVENPKEAVDFSIKLPLKTTDKYITFYAPNCLMQLSGLSLKGENIETSVVGISASENAETLYFDLQGRRAGMDGNLQPGIYIVRKGAKVEKIAIR